MCKCSSNRFQIKQIIKYNKRICNDDNHYHLHNGVSVRAIIGKSDNNDYCGGHGGGGGGGSCSDFKGRSTKSFYSLIESRRLIMENHHSPTRTTATALQLNHGLLAYLIQNSNYDSILGGGGKSNNGYNNNNNGIKSILLLLIIIFSFCINIAGGGRF